MSESARARKSNVLDFLVLILLAAGILSLVLRGNLARELGLQEVGSKAEYTLHFVGLSKEEADSIAAGATLIYPATGETIGTVLSTHRENTRVYAADDTGKIKVGFDPAQFELTLTVAGMGKRTDKGFLLNAAIFASPGDTLMVYCNARSFTATVLESHNT